MMLAYRLVRLIEARSHTLADSLLDRVKQSDLLRDYRKVPASELQERVFEIYRHLGDWLLAQGEFDIKERYVEIGTPREQQCASQPAGVGDCADQGKFMGLPETGGGHGPSHRDFR